MFANFAKVFEEMAKSVPMMAGMMTNEFSAQAKVNGFPGPLPRLRKRQARR